MSDTIPITMSATGPVPRTPQAILAQLLALVSQASPGYTANLPGIMIEDISSTDVYALTISESALTDLINSVSPYFANPYILNLLGQVYLGQNAGRATNTSVYVTFMGSAAGFPVKPGFIVSDGTYQYTVMDGGVIGTDLNSDPLFCVATIAGTWAVPIGTVNQVITSTGVTGFTLTCTNLLAGTPSAGAQTEAQYRTQVLQAGMAEAQGVANFTKTLINKVPGVQARLVSMRQQPVGGWEIIVGGGDPYQVGNAIWQGVSDVSLLQGSTINVLGITTANPGVVTTDIDHNYSNGQVIVMEGVQGMTNVNGVPYTITVTGPHHFSLNASTLAFPAWTSGGIVTPNLRNQTISIYDYPDTYAVPFVLPPLQTVEIVCLWNTTATNYVSNQAMSQTASIAIVDYINSIGVGQPINIFELNSVFQIATAAILPTALLTRLVFEVSINGVGVAPDTGTGIVEGDPESYFFIQAGNVTVNQG